MKNKLNNVIATLKLLRKRTVPILILIVVIASGSMIVMNYYTIKILSATRAYINGESEYSKGQKDASAHLIYYIYLENEADYASFEKEISVPAGDRIARIALSEKNNVRGARKGFLLGNNHPDDIDNMIWLFNNFQHLAIFEKVINIWIGGDAMVNKLQLLGLQSHQKIISGKVSASEKKALTISISNISDDLTIKEQAFHILCATFPVKLIYMFLLPIY